MSQSSEHGISSGEFIIKGNNKYTENGSYPIFSATVRGWGLVVRFFFLMKL